MLNYHLYVDVFFRFYIPSSMSMFWAGAARSMTSTCIPFLVASDTSLLVHAESSSEKRLRCLSQIYALAAQRTGVTELSLLDHDMNQTIQDKDPTFNVCGLILNELSCIMLNSFVPLPGRQCCSLQVFCDA